MERIRIVGTLIDGSNYYLADPVYLSFLLYLEIKTAVVLNVRHLSWRSDTWYQPGLDFGSYISVFVGLSSFWCLGILVGELLGGRERKGEINFTVLGNGFGNFLAAFLISFEGSWLKGLASFRKVGKENTFIFKWVNNLSPFLQTSKIALEEGSCLFR